MNTRKTMLTLTVLAAAFLGTAAQARGPDVQWQVTVGTPVLHLPGHVRLPLPPLPRIVVSTPVHGPDYRDHREYRDHRDYRDDRGYRDHRGYRDAGYREPRRWDVDGDGVPNRYDRRPNNPRDARGGRD